jgi:ATP-dependent Clp protease adaptor protein ClpS
MSFRSIKDSHGMEDIGLDFETKLSDDGQTSNDDSSVAVQPAEPKLKRPSLYRVVIMNDDYTPMEFVVHILEQFFAMGREKATQVMLAVHTQGKGVCGVYTKDIAETKAALVNDYSRENQHPLLCEVEEIDGDSH